MGTGGGLTSGIRGDANRDNDCLERLRGGTGGTDANETSSLGRGIFGRNTGDFGGL